MKDFKIISDLNQITLSPEWIDAQSSNDEIVVKDGRSYQLIVKERSLLTSEKIG